MIKEAIKKLVAGNDLTFDEAAQVMDEMFSGTATQSQMAAYLTALRIKGETIDEITASAQVMREKALHIKPNRDVLDIVGTGGDGTGTFNISTTAAFIIAAAGIPVAKHGNGSMSSTAEPENEYAEAAYRKIMTGESVYLFNLAVFVTVKFAYTRADHCRAYKCAYTADHMYAV